MRRSEREITSRDEIDAILWREKVVRVAFAAGNEPYVIPLSYGYDREADCLYLHTAAEGRKLEFVACNPRVCFEVEGPATLRAGKKACDWGLSYESVVGYGTLSEIVTPMKKTHALACLMRQQTGFATGWSFDTALARTRMWRIAIESLTGKRTV